MTPEETRLLQECLIAYVHEDYSEAIKYVARLPQDESPITVRLVMIICLQRLGEHELCKNLEQQFAKIGRAADPYIGKLVDMIFGKASLNEVLALADGDAECICEANYFAGAIAYTNGDRETAEKQFKICTDSGVSTTAQNLAKAHLDREKASAAANATEDIIKAFIDRDYERVTELCIGSAGVLLEAALLNFLSMQRIGSMPKQPADDSADIPKDKWETAMVKMVCGNATLNEALRYAEDDKKRTCQAYFYWGARLRTIGQEAEARKSLRKCLELAIDIPEAKMADIELSELDSPLEGDYARQRRDLTFRVFVSSPFSDFVEERNALQDEVFRSLADYCQQRGAKFQAIDLRWGVDRESALDQQTMSICLEELRRCQEVSPKPNFIVLLGNRYGWIPLPAQIDADEFEGLLKELSKEEQSDVNAWYLRDDNAVSPMYLLRPREGTYAGDADWAPVEERLRQLLSKAVQRYFAQEDFLAPDYDPRRENYEQSATHQEIVFGALNPRIAQHARQHCLCCCREIVDLPADESARSYRDLLPNGKPDTVAENRLKELKGTIRKLLPEDQVREYQASWRDGKPAYDVGKLGRDVETHLRRIIDQELDEFQRKSDSEREQQVHRAFAEERGRQVVGRDDVLAQIQQYVLHDDSKRSLVITGSPGAGKTAVLAHAWLHLEDSTSKVVTLARFLGASPESSDLHSLLSGIVRQLDALRGRESPITSDSSKLADELLARLWDTPEDTTLVLFLDALDQLNPNDDAHSLYWLPLQEELPPRVKLVLSVAELESSRCYDQIRRWCPNRILSLHSLSDDDGDAILRLWLRDANRTLQAEQRQEILRGFSSCRSPLYLKLAFEEARHWTSYVGLPRRLEGGQGLATDTPGLLADVFHRLEQPEQFGAVLPGRALSYLAAARLGLTEDELLRVLSEDDDVIGDHRQRSPDSPVVSRLPFVIWSRLFSTLKPYLAIRSYEGEQLIGFYHRQVAEAIESRYLDESGRRTAHAGLVRIFAGQELYFREAQTASARRGAVNRRLVDELPWQLTHGAESGEESFKKMLEQTLTDLSFIEAKCLAGKVYDLESDYVRAVTLIGQDQDDIRSSRIQQYACDLADYARKHHPSTGLMAATNSFDKVPAVRQPPDVPAAIELSSPHSKGGTRLSEFAEFVSTHSHKLVDYPYETVQFARRQSSGEHVAAAANRLYENRQLVWFDIDPPSTDSESTRGLIRTLRHSAKHVAIDAAGKIGLSVGGRTHSVRFWDLTTGAPSRIGSEHHDDVDHAAMTPDGRFALTGGGTWSILTTGGTQDGCHIASPVLGYSGRPMTIVPDYSLRVWDVSAGECIAELIGHRDDIQALALSADGNLAVSASRDQTIRLWDTSSARCLRTIRNCLKPIDTLSMDAAGRICVAVCGSGRLHIWEIGTRNWRFIRPTAEQKFQAATVTPDGRLIVAITEKTLQVWEVDARKPLLQREFPEKMDKAFAITPDGRLFFGSINKSDLLINELHDNSAPPITVKGAGSEHSIAITPDAKYLLNAASAETRLWDLADVGAVEPETSDDTSYWFGPRIVGPHGSRLIKSSKKDEDAGISILRLARGDNESLRRVDLESLCAEGLSKAAFLSCGRRIATLNRDKHVELWDTNNGARLLHLGDRDAALLATAARADVLAFVQGDKSIQVFDCDGNHRHALDDHREPVAAVAITGNGQFALSTGGAEERLNEKDQQAEKNDGDYELRVWDLRSGQLVHKLPKAPARAEQLVADRHGWGAATISHDMLHSGGFVEFWDLEFGLRRGRHLIAPILLHGSDSLNFVRNLCVAPDGATFAVGAFNNQMKHVQIYYSCSQSVEQLAGTDMLFSRIAFVRSGRVIIGDAWGTGQLRVWDFVTGELLATCLSPPDDGTGDFGWIDGDSETCICPDRKGGFGTFRIRNLPPLNLSLGELRSQLSSDNPRQRLAALWYAIDHPPSVHFAPDQAKAYSNCLFDLVCSTDDGPYAESLRHAAVRAAIRFGPGVIPSVVERLAQETSSQAVGQLVLVLGPFATSDLSSVVSKALLAAAEHADSRVRKRVAVVLRRYFPAPSADNILLDLRRSDPLIDDFLNLVEHGIADGQCLDRRDRNMEQADLDFSTTLCPTSMSEIQATNQMFGEDIYKITRQGRTVVAGGSHPYLESVLMKQSLSVAIENEDYERAAQLRDDLEFLEKAHNLEEDVAKRVRDYFDRLVALECVSIPVKRVLAGLVSDTLEDDKLEFLSKCLQYVEDGFEEFDDWSFIAVRDELKMIDDERVLLQTLGVRELSSSVVGLGPSSWREYANALSDDQPRLLYCLVNEFVQCLYDYWIAQERNASKWKPKPERHFLAEKVFVDLGHEERAWALRKIYMQLFGDADVVL